MITGLFLLKMNERKFPRENIISIAVYTLLRYQISDGQTKSHAVVFLTDLARLFKSENIRLAGAC